MPERIITVDFEGVESGTSFTKVPEGDYMLEITGVKGKKGKESEKPNLLITFKMSEGPAKGNGKSIGHNCSLQKQSLWNLRNLLEACGKTVPPKAVKLNLDKMIGWKCAGTVVDSEYNGKPRSEIAAFFPVDDFGATAEDGNELEDEAEETPKKTASKKSGKKKTEEVEEEETTESDDAEEIFS